MYLYFDYRSQSFCLGILSMCSAKQPCMVLCDMLYRYLYGGGAKIFSASMGVTVYSICCILIDIEFILKQCDCSCPVSLFMEGQCILNKLIIVQTV